MGVVRYFWDTYAIVELLHGNPRYAKYASEPVSLTMFNLAEIYWTALREYSVEKARQIYDLYRPAVVDIDDHTLKAAIEYRKQHKRKRLSYADCVGYLFAVRHGMKFLTGDKEFEGLDYVEFVK